MPPKNQTAQAAQTNQPPSKRAVNRDVNRIARQARKGLSQQAKEEQNKRAQQLADEQKAMDDVKRADIEAKKSELSKKQQNLFTALKKASDDGDYDKQLDLVNQLRDTEKEIDGLNAELKQLSKTKYDPKSAQKREEAYSKEQEKQASEQAAQEAGGEAASGGASGGGADSSGGGSTTSSGGSGGDGGDSGSDSETNAAVGQGSDGSGVGGAAANLAMQALQANHPDSKDPTGLAAAERAQAGLLINQAGEEQKGAQYNAQRANRDPYAEADKAALSKSETENANRIAEAGSVDAKNALLQKVDAEADPNAEKDRNEANQEKAMQQTRNRTTDLGNAAQLNANAQQRDYLSKQDNQYNTNSTGLSMGPPAGNGASDTAPQEETQEETPQQEEAQEEPQEEAAQEAPQEEPQQEEAPQQEETPQPEPEPPTEPAPEPEPEAPQQDIAATGDPQKVINELTGAEDPKNRPQTEGDKALLQQVMQEFRGIKRITRNSESRKNVNLAEQQFIDEMAAIGADGAGAMKWLRGERGGGDASKNYSKDASGTFRAEGDNSAMNRSTNVGSDARIKNIISDMRMKNIVNTLRGFRFF